MSKLSDCPHGHCVDGWLELHGPELEIVKCPHCQKKGDFCRHCGASIPPRDGEGTCERCEPIKTRLMGLWQAYAQHKRSCNVVQQPRIYTHCNCGLPSSSLEFGALVRKLNEKG